MTKKPEGFSLRNYKAGEILPDPKTAKMPAPAAKRRPKNASNPKPAKSAETPPKPSPKKAPGQSRERTHSMNTKLNDEELAAFDKKLDGRPRSKIIRQLINAYAKT